MTAAFRNYQSKQDVTDKFTSESQNLEERVAYWNCNLLIITVAKTNYRLFWNKS